MATDYGTYTGQGNMAPNRNSAISSPRSRATSGTSAVRNQMNIPAPVQPRGRRQTPFGGKKTGPSMNYGKYPMTPSFNPNEGSSAVNVNENPQSGPNPFQDQLRRMNQMKTRGNYGNEIPRGNMQGAPPVGIYNRPQPSTRLSRNY